MCGYNTTVTCLLSASDVPAALNPAQRRFRLFRVRWLLERCGWHATLSLCRKMTLRCSRVGVFCCLAFHVTDIPCDTLRVWTYRSLSFSFGILVKVCLRAVFVFLWSALPADGPPWVLFLGLAAAPLSFSLCWRSKTQLPTVILQSFFCLKCVFFSATLNVGKMESRSR